ncbi:MAG: MBL fold metallo-hydrolase [Bacteroidia bacterium]|nr:MBL fold metallo-hydrolase [Bacteroidia bacterium]
MELFTIETGNFKLDGGAMFGVVPKSIWHKLNPADDNNMISLAMRCLLVQDGDRLILIDNGMGSKQDAKFFGYYFLHGDFSLDASLAKHGFSRNDITDMVLTHLHFDHCGGSIQYNADRTKLETAFPNAIYWVAEDHWNEAMSPNPREKASFLKENILPIKESGQLQLLQPGQQFHKDIDILFSKGHTQHMMHPLIPYKGTKLLYLADVIPTQAHLPIPYVMGYDVRPLDTMKEKTDILAMAAENNWVLYFEHDPFHAACTVQQTEKGVKILDQVVV